MNRQTIGRFITGAVLIGCSAASQSQDGEPAAPVVDSRPALPLPGDGELVTVCGHQDDLQHVELYSPPAGSWPTSSYVQAHEKSTVQLQWIDLDTIRRSYPANRPGNVAGERWCTGTLIGPATVLTAGHCFDVQDGKHGWTSPYRPTDKGPVWLQPAELAKLMRINFNFQVNRDTKELRAADSFPIASLQEYRKGGLDYAIVTVGADGQGRLPADLGYPLAQLSGTAPQNQAPLAIIQHPQGDPKKVHSGQFLRRIGSDLYYGNIDTHGGSSGSAVRDERGQIVGVHTNGGCTTTGGANRGVGLSAIRAASVIL